jgi:Helix-turn-helix domain
MKNDKNPGQNPAQKPALKIPVAGLPSKETVQSHLTPPPPLPEPLAYDINQSAAALNMSTKSVRRLIWIGKLTPCKALRKILIPRKQIEDFFKGN